MTVVITRWEFAASAEAVGDMLDVVDRLTEGIGARAAFDLRLACEEIIVNVASYAYPDGDGRLTLTWDHDPTARTVMARFEDSGVPFNPLDQPEPPLDAPVSEREVGGLGIMMARRRADDVRYERREGRNVLTLTKRY